MILGLIAAAIGSDSAQSSLMSKQKNLGGNLLTSNSDEAYHLQALHYGIPSFKSFSQFHDSQMVNTDGTEKGGAYKFFSIFPFIPANYYSAVGTLIDSKNWTQNSSQSNNNSNSVSRYDKQNE